MFKSLHTQIYCIWNKNKFPLNLFWFKWKSTYTKLYRWKKKTFLELHSFIYSNASNVEKEALLSLGMENGAQNERNEKETNFRKYVNRTRKELNRKHSTFNAFKYYILYHWEDAFGILWNIFIEKLLFARKNFLPNVIKAKWHNFLQFDFTVSPRYIL